MNPELKQLLQLPPKTQAVFDAMDVTQRTYALALAAVQAAEESSRVTATELNELRGTLEQATIAMVEDVRERMSLYNPVKFKKIETAFTRFNRGTLTPQQRDQLVAIAFKCPSRATIARNLKTKNVLGCPRCGNEWPSQEGPPCPKCGY